MAYERKKDGTKSESAYNYVIVNEEDEEYESDSSDTFFNGPKRGKKGLTKFSPRVQVALCIIFSLAVILFIFVVYNFLAFIIAFQSAMERFNQQIPMICKTAQLLNSKVAHGLSFCPNVTATSATPRNVSL